MVASARVKGKKFTDFELGVIHGAAILARRGEDTFCEELLGTIGIMTVRDVLARGLERYDREAIIEMLRRAK